MTPKEAIYWIENLNLRHSDHKELVEAVNLAFEALEKQIPKKPKIYTDTRNYMDMYGNVTDSYDVDVYECPNCGAYITERYKDDTHELVPNYCNNCGQCLDWSEEE